MKCKSIFWVVFLLSVSFTGIIYAAEIKADSRIAEVTVYPDSAIITRFASVSLESGDQRVVFPDIIPDVDENSLRVSARGASEVKLFGAQVKKEFLEDVPSDRIKQINDEVRKLEDEKSGIEDAKAVLSEEKQFLDSIRLFAHTQIPKDLVTRMPQASELEGLLAFLGVKLKDNFSAYSGHKFRIRDINEKIDILRRQLAEISGPGKKLKREIVVDLTALSAVTVNIGISYMVRGASWQPIYEARASFENQELELVSSGIIRQNTGEDWQDVEMSLSTARLTVSGNMPYVGPWLLRPHQPMERKGKRSIDQASGMDMMKASTLQHEAFDFKERLEESGESVEAEFVYTQPREKGTAVAYKLPKKVSVKADGSDHKLPISAQMLSAGFEYSTYPRSMPCAYLGSRATNAPDLQLLGGRVNIFLEGDFTGASSIPAIGPGEEFDLYLGADESVKVKREQIEKKVDETIIGAISSSTRRVVFKYKLTVENYKSKKIKVKLFEAMPISEDDRI
ncbi:MAG: mucoidy inhibitor MuiA family protein, partial [Candidatus Omnitrophota bacterium]